MAFDFLYLKISSFGKTLLSVPVRGGQKTEAEFWAKPLKEKAFFRGRANMSFRPQSCDWISVVLRAAVKKKERPYCFMFEINHDHEIVESGEPLTMPFFVLPFLEAVSEKGNMIFFLSSGSALVVQQMGPERSIDRSYADSSIRQQ